MDPAALIAAALSGISVGIAGTVSEAAKQAYQDLRAMIQHKFANHPKAQQALADYEEDPETYERPFKKTLMQEQVDQDQNIIEAAKKVMTLIQPQQASQGKYNVQVTGDVQGYAQGDYQQTTMHFGNTPKE